MEHELFFLHKVVEEYGINPGNGLYYDLKPREDGLEGVLKEVDLNVLVAPPEDGVLHPVTEDMLFDTEPANHLFPRLTIN